MFIKLFWRCTMKKTEVITFWAGSIFSDIINSCEDIGEAKKSVGRLSQAERPVKEKTSNKCTVGGQMDH